MATAESGHTTAYMDLISHGSSCTFVERALAGGDVILTLDDQCKAHDSLLAFLGG